MNDDWFISICPDCGGEKYHDPPHSGELRRGTSCPDCGTWRVVVEDGEPVDAYAADTE